jgi:hypothetical protein
MLEGKKFGFARGALFVAESKMDHEILPLAGDQSRLAASAAAGDYARRCWQLKTRSLRLRVRSHADDLDAEAGAVRSRVALLLRSAEAYPVFSRFVLVLLRFMLREYFFKGKSRLEPVVVWGC